MKIDHASIKTQWMDFLANQLNKKFMLGEYETYFNVSCSAHPSDKNKILITTSDIDQKDKLLELTFDINEIPNLNSSEEELNAFCAKLIDIHEQSQDPNVIAERNAYKATKYFLELFLSKQEALANNDAVAQDSFASKLLQTHMLNPNTSSRALFSTFRTMVKALSSDFNIDISNSLVFDEDQAGERKEQEDQVKDIKKQAQDILDRIIPVIHTPDYHSNYLEPPYKDPKTGLFITYEVVVANNIKSDILLRSPHYRHLLDTKSAEASVLKQAGISMEEIHEVALRNINDMMFCNGKTELKSQMVSEIDTQGGNGYTRIKQHSCDEFILSTPYGILNGFVLSESFQDHLQDMQEKLQQPMAVIMARDRILVTDFPDGYNAVINNRADESLSLNAYIFSDGNFTQIVQDMVLPQVFDIKLKAKTINDLKDQGVILTKYKNLAIAYKTPVGYVTKNHVFSKDKQFRNVQDLHDHALHNMQNFYSLLGVVSLPTPSFWLTEEYKSTLRYLQTKNAEPIVFFQHRNGSLKEFPLKLDPLLQNPKKECFFDLKSSDFSSVYIFDHDDIKVVSDRETYLEILHGGRGDGEQEVELEYEYEYDGSDYDR